jgi:hypothetical protein
MDIVKVPLGSSVVADLAISSGNLIVTLTVSAKPEIDTLIASLMPKFPVALQPVLSAIQAGIDAELAAP